MSDEYPESCLKGIPSKDLLKGKTVRWTAFKPPSSSVAKNGWYESSINWEFTDLALKQLLDCCDEDGTKKYPAGVARVPKVELDNIIDRYEVQDTFRYELAPVDGNLFHGNLLFHSNLINAKGAEKGDQALILSAISNSVTKVEENRVREALENCVVQKN